MSLKNKLFEFDKEKKTPILIGTDEAGRGPGAGGVFASAVCFTSVDDELIEKLASLNDSKKLSKKIREELFEVIIKNSISSTVCIEVEEIEQINILNASLRAMKLCCEKVLEQIEISGLGLSTQKDKNNILTLVDGNKLIKQFEYQQQFVIKGDSKSASIAAASILAKVTRDRYMQELDKQFPHYNWKNNAGYLTKQHLEAVDEFGITPIHRKTFLRKHFERKKECSSTQLNLSQK